jgi:glyoxylase-like metal-dependent hydrolase (beta-lactamase superfamily II)
MSAEGGDTAGAARLWREVADRVYVRRYADFNVNVGLIVGAESALVVDTHGSERQGRELLAEVRRITGVRLVASNTHHHYDHAFGNSAFVPADIWGHERCAERLRVDGRTTQLALAAAMPELAEEYADTPITPPNKTFRGSVTLELGERLVHLAHFGRGHTDNDVVVVVPDVGVVLAGDLVEQGAPPSFEDSYPLDWPGTLGRMLDVADGPIVPGHGEVVDRSFVEAQLADLSALAQLARRVSLDGGSADDALPLAPFPAAAARVALQRAFAQLSGEPGGGRVPRRS